MTPEVTVIIPTFCRPEDLRRAVQSALAQVNAPPFEILIVDNDPSGSAKSTVDSLVNKAPSSIPVRYIHEPNAGVANARNTAIDHTKTKLVAFLDDDQSAPKNWLEALTSFNMGTPVPATFGPVITQLPEGAKLHRSYLEDFFARTPNHPSGLIEQYYGCGNCLLDLSLIKFEGPLFDTEMNETGGEDDVLFQAILKNGQKFGWCAEAPVFEHVPKTRATLDYTLKRAFSYGQGPITLARKASPRQNAKIALWMIIGSAKAVTNVALYAGSWILRSPTRAVFLDRAIRGAGKVFWWVDMKFYGAGALKKKSLSQ